MQKQMFQTTCINMEEGHKPKNVVILEKLEKIKKPSLDPSKEI